MNALKDLHDINLIEPKKPSLLSALIFPIVSVTLVLGFALWFMIIIPRQLLEDERFKHDTAQASFDSMLPLVAEVTALQEKVGVIRATTAQTEAYFNNTITLRDALIKVENARPGGVFITSMSLGDNTVSLICEAENTLQVSQYLANLRKDPDFLTLSLGSVSTTQITELPPYVDPLIKVNPELPVPTPTVRAVVSFSVTISYTTGTMEETPATEVTP